MNMENMQRDYSTPQMKVRLALTILGLLSAGAGFALLLWVNWKVTLGVALLLYGKRLIEDN